MNNVLVNRPTHTLLNGQYVTIGTLSSYDSK